ncbi:SURF1 family protein [Solimonas marina]|uniref:SURF1-like protein n=1 Tax=Solimonas marina TaxID=2714601 RepID=A0A969W879_9GAMM|nr:SURF1 family protein [Solimonas marina]NKF22212.1 SURF1 family protein [Solimonas marina]
MTRRFRPPRWALIATPLACAAMVVLGIWQLDRGFEKQAILDRYAHAGAQAPAVLTAASVARPEAIVRAEVHGHFDAGRQLLLDNQGHDGQPGYHVWTPLQQDDGSTVVVDRGWIPHDAAQDAEALLPPGGMRSVDGYWRTPPVPGLRLAVDNCAAAPWPRIVQFPTIDDLRCLYGSTVAAGVLLMAPNAPGGYVRDWQTTPELNPALHYGYAGQWFAFTLTLLVIFIKLSFREPPSNP